MSMAFCHDCGRLMDTDDDPDAFIEVGNMRSQSKTIIVCEPCREQRQADQDALDEAAEQCIAQSQEKPNGV
jgi:hypothetical protein